MATDMFKAVHLAEEKADAILGEAQREALKRVKDTEASCVKAERDMAREHRALYQSILEEKRQSMKQELDQNAQQERQTIQARMDEARGRLPQAVERIVERVMSNGDR